MVNLVLIGLTIAWNVFVISTTAVLIQMRHQLTVRFRNITLTVGGAIATLIQSDVWIMMILFPGQISCYIYLWIISIVGPLWFLTFFGKFLKLGISYQYARIKMHASSHIPFFPFNQQTHPLRQAHSQSKYEFSNKNDGPHHYSNIDINEEEQDDDTQNRLSSKKYSSDSAQLFPQKCKVNTNTNILDQSWYHQNRARWGLKGILITIFCLQTIHILIATVTQILTKDFAIHAPPLPNCLTHIEMVPLWVVAVLYFTIGGPMIALMLWSAQDAYLLKLELQILVVACAPTVIIFLLLTYMPGWKDVIPPTSILVFLHIMSHGASVLVPIYDVYRSSKRKTANNLSRFHALLKDRTRFEHFKKFTISDITIENPLFYEQYTQFLDSWESAHPQYTRHSLSMEQSYFSAQNKVPFHHNHNKDSFGYKVVNVHIGGSNSSVMADRHFSGLSPPALTSAAIRSKHPEEPHKTESNTTSIALGPISKPSEKITSSSQEHHIPKEFDQQQKHQQQSQSQLPAQSLNTSEFQLCHQDVAFLVDLFNKFIAPGSDYQLNLNGATVKHLNTLIETRQFSPYMFTPVLEQVLDNMYRNTFVRYVKFMK